MRAAATRSELLCRRSRLRCDSRDTTIFSRRAHGLSVRERAAATLREHAKRLQHVLLRSCDLIGHHHHRFDGDAHRWFIIVESFRISPSPTCGASHVVSTPCAAVSSSPSVRSDTPASRAAVSTSACSPRAQWPAMELGFRTHVKFIISRGPTRSSRASFAQCSRAARRAPTAPPR